MTVVISQGDATGYLFVALIGMILLRRAYAQTQGVLIGSARVIGLPVVYVGLYIAELSAIGVGAYGTALAGQIYIAFAVDAALLIVGVFLAYGYTLRHVEIYRSAGDRGWKYRLNAVLPVLYVILFVARVLLETVVLNESSFAFPSAATFRGVSTLSLLSLFVVDALWGLSTGFLVGRSAAVYHEWQGKLRSAAPPLTDPALP